MRRLLPVVLGISLVMLLASCTPGATITYTNSTSFPVRVYGDGGFITSLAPGESRRLSHHKHQWDEHVSAENAEGEVVWEDQITWDELEDSGFRIVISDRRDTPGPTPTLSVWRFSEETEP